MARRAVTPVPLLVHWYRDENDQWLKLEELDLTHDLVRQRGVYIIFNPFEPDNRAFYVGQGKVHERLDERKTDERILEWAELDELYVTWARLAVERKRLGVERFLADTLNPLVGEHPDVPPIAVNVPSLFQ